MKKTIFYALIFLIVFLIYYFNADKKIYYLSLGDYLSYGMNNFQKNTGGYSEKIKKYYKSNLKNYVNYSSYDDYGVMDLINDINYNKEINYKNKKYKLQNLLIKSNLITISIGMNDLIYRKKLDYDYADNLLSDINKLLSTIRKYNKDKIYFLSFYDAINNKELIEYINNKLEKVCDKNKVYYIDITNLTKYTINNEYPSNNGYLYIKDQILNFTKK